MAAEGRPVAVVTTRVPVSPLETSLIRYHRARAQVKDIICSGLRNLTFSEEDGKLWIYGTEFTAEFEIRGYAAGFKAPGGFLGWRDIEAIDAEDTRRDLAAIPGEHTIVGITPTALLVSVNGDLLEYDWRGRTLKFVD
jgi:hypothetical protein